MELSNSRAWRLLDSFYISRFAVVAPGWDAACERMAERIEALGWDRFTYRPA